MFSFLYIPHLEEGYKWNDRRDEITGTIFSANRFLMCDVCYSQLNWNNRAVESFRKKISKMKCDLSNLR